MEIQSGQPYAFSRKGIVQILAALVLVGGSLIANPTAAFAESDVNMYSSDASHGGHTYGPPVVFGTSGHDYSFALTNADVAPDGKGSWTIVFAAGDSQSKTGWRDHNTDGNGTSHYKNGGGDVGFTIRYVEVQACNGAGTVSGQTVARNCTYRQFDNPYN